MRKIAIVIPKYGLVGGAEGFAAELTERIARNTAYELHVFANDWHAHSGEITFHKVPIITFPKFLTTVSFAFFAKRLISRIPFDLIHAHDRIFRADIYTMHGIPHKTWVTKVRRKKQMSLFDRTTVWVEKRMVADGGCRRFLAVSQIAEDMFLREYPVDPERVSIIHPGIRIKEVDSFTREQSRQNIRKQYGIDPADVLILFVSMNFDVKGLDAVMAGMARFKSIQPSEKIKLLVVGKGRESHYRHLAHRLGIGDDVIFSGKVNRDALERIYYAGDLYAMLSKFDTFGLVVLEAMAASLPVLISENVGAKDLVSDGINGFIIDNNADPDMIAGKLAIMMSSDIRDRFAREALKTAADHSWDKVAAKVEAIYEEILEQRT
ncbi:MAG: glycosyltransferase family 4 protein [Pseudomonadota bacterium]